MTKTASDKGGSFIVNANFKLDNFTVPFIDIQVKIDTGCSISTIPVRRLHATKNSCEQKKLYDIQNNLKYYLSYGVETGGIKHDIPETEQEKMNCPAMKFEHGITDFYIDGIKICDTTICLNYDRNSNVLIGMDILKDWDIHIGTIETGETFLLACPNNQLNDDYYRELNRLFKMSEQR
jgi:hypothetical protein